MNFLIAVFDQLLKAGVPFGAALATVVVLGMVLGLGVGFVAGRAR